MVVNMKVQSISSVNGFNKPQKTQNFCQNKPVTQNDNFVSCKNETKKLSTGVKWAIGIGIAGVAIGALVLLTRGRAPKLASHINFREANTMEEAVNFAKKHLGIKKYNLGNNLDVANSVNEALTRVNNIYKGTAHMPRVVRYAASGELGKNVPAAMKLCPLYMLSPNELIIKKGADIGSREIYHEMGHLQHLANCSLKDYIFGSLSPKGMKDFGSYKTYQITSWASEYANTSPYEFVAEVFKDMCRGYEPPKEVINLYKYYKGPKFPGIV